ncbi:hypothetical protein [Pseudomonas arsenicoxydans]|nr:hypothetical protein [Pseudomonas arsenicoxydans]
MRYLKVIAQDVSGKGQADTLHFGFTKMNTGCARQPRLIVIGSRLSVKRI